MPDNFPIFEWGPGIVVDDAMVDDNFDANDDDDTEHMPEPEIGLEELHENTNNVISDDEYSVPSGDDGDDLSIDDAKIDGYIINDDLNDEEDIVDEEVFNDNSSIYSNPTDSNETDEDFVPEDDSISAMSVVDDDCNVSVHSSEFSFNMPDTDGCSILGEDIKDSDASDVHDNNANLDDANEKFSFGDEPTNEGDEIESGDN